MKLANEARNHCEPHFPFYAPTQLVAPSAVSIADAIDAIS